VRSSPRSTSNGCASSVRTSPSSSI
jgi:hypothetical protein